MDPEARFGVWQAADLVRLAGGQPPGDLRPGRRRGDGLRPAGRRLGLGRLPRPRRSRRDRPAGADARWSRGATSGVDRAAAVRRDRLRPFPRRDQPDGRRRRGSRGRRDRPPRERRRLSPRPGDRARQPGRRAVRLAPGHRRATRPSGTSRTPCAVRGRTLRPIRSPRRCIRPRSGRSRPIPRAGSASRTSEVAATEHAERDLPRLLALPLTHHVAESRVSDAPLLLAALALASPRCPISSLDASFARPASISVAAGRPWRGCSSMTSCGLVRTARIRRSNVSHARPVRPPELPGPVRPHRRITSRGREGGAALRHRAAAGEPRRRAEDPVPTSAAARARRPTTAAAPSRTPSGTPTPSTRRASRARPAARPDRRPQRVRLDAVPPRAVPDVPDRQLFRVLLPSARLRHGLPARLPPGASRLPPRPDAQRDDPAGPGQLPPRLQPDALPEEPVPGRVPDPRSR